MPQNTEIKAIDRDPARTRTLAERLATEPPVEIVQRDTFFGAGQTRLKLREFPAASPAGSPAPAELILYDRPDAPGPKASTYAITRTADPAGLRAILAAVLGTVGEVRKRRTLIMAGRTRIHLDEVDGLGHFVELEVVLADGEDPAAGEAEARALMATLEIDPADLVAGAYLDLLDARGPGV
jgi:adenylate cyclase class IV